MHPHEQQILSAYAREPQAVRTTGELVREVYPDLYASIQQDLASPDPKTQRQGTRNKARLHRKLLYHLGKLIERKALRVAEIRGRGEKAYALAIAAGEIVLHDKDTTVAITRHPEPESFINKELERGDAHILTQALHKVDAYAISAKSHPGPAHLRRTLLHLYTHIEDALGILDYEHYLDQDPQTQNEAIADLIADTKDYQLSLTLTINLNARRLTHKDLAFFTTFALHKPRRLYIIFSGSREELNAQRAILARIAEAFSQNNIKLNIHTTDKHPRALLMGRAGTYRLSQEQLQSAQRGTVVSAGSVAIDLGREVMSPETLRDLATRSAKTLLARQALQRRLGTTLFAGMSAVGSIRDQLEWAESYVRIWNYDEERYPHHELLASIRERLQEFSRQERMIFAASGVPINYHARLSSAFPHFADLSARTYQKTPVYGSASLERQQLATREKRATNYDCDRVRLFREGNTDGDGLISEVLGIVKSHDLSLITYDFSQLKKTKSLTEFMQ